MRHPVVLGPCPCRACGEPVYWDGWGWRNVWRNAEHDCLARANAKWDNGRAGSSSESNRLPNDARVSATTRGAGVVAPIEVVAR